MKIPFEWEDITREEDEKDQYWQATYRAKVFGGWLVRFQVMWDVIEHALLKDDTSYQLKTNEMVFVPDSKHEWEV